ncbi:hypothetical protein D9M71_248320 [compost metagenome]
MRAGSYVDYLFGVATGWLGWPPETAWRTPIPQILLALEARLDWMSPSQPVAQVQEKPRGVAEKIKKLFEARG